MDSRDVPPRALVVTGNFVVAEDLADILREHRGASVDARSSLEEEWGGDYEVAVLDMSPENLLDDSRLVELLRAGTRLIVLDGLRAGVTDSVSGLSVLAQPFTTIDVVRLLESLGLARRG